MPLTGPRVAIGILAAGLMLAGGASLAQGADEETQGKFRLDGARLIYDTDQPGEDEDEGIRDADIDRLLSILRFNPQIRVVQLNSGGGSVFASERMSDMILDFELDTEIHGDCDSACVTLFLAGTRRTMTRGSRLGFHQPVWSAANIETYYENERETHGWDTPFDFVEWVYGDTQNEVYRRLAYVVSRGVDPGFAIESIREPQGDLWRPKRAQLLGAGVLTE